MADNIPVGNLLTGFTALDQTHKDIINGLLKNDPPLTSELTFTNLFMWRHYYRPHWVVMDDCLLVICLPPNQPPFGLPPVGHGDKREALAWLMNHFAASGKSPEVQRLSRYDLEKYVDGSLYVVESEPAQNDYVYLTDDLTKLAGRKLHQKKNHVNQFMKKYQFEWHHLNTKHIGEITAMQEDWCSLKNCSSDPSLLNEDLAISEALSNFELLGYQGLVVKVDGKVEAFTFGEWLNHETAVVHIEKANPEIQGLYATINQLFCREVLAGFKFVNREQDLGIEGLRRAKESYHPHHMVEKYRVTVRNQAARVDLF